MHQSWTKRVQDKTELASDGGPMRIVQEIKI